MDHPRRKKLIKPALQLRIIAVFFCIAACAVLAQVLMLNYTVMRIAEGLPNDGDLLHGLLPSILGGGVTLAFLVLVPLITVIGILVTFTIAGPVHAFETYLRSFLAGRRPAPCRVRKGDEFGELCELINAATQAHLAQQGTILRTSTTAVGPAAALPATPEPSEITPE